MQKISTSYKLTIRAHWDDERPPVDIQVREIPNDQSPADVIELLRPSLILGPDCLEFRELAAGGICGFLIIGSTKPRRGRPPK